MGRLGIVCVEVERPSGPLRKWDDALRAQIGAFREQEAVRCLPMDGRPFKGRIEHGALGEMLLCKVAATHYRVTRSSTTPAPTLLTGTMLVSVSKGYCKFVQRGRTCILGPRDWALIDSKLSQGYEISSPEIEAFVTILPRPSDPTVAALCECGVTRRSSGRWGLSRFLHAMVNESFAEMRRLPGSSGRKLGAAIATMAWDALREQIEAPRMIGCRDELSMRVKTFILRRSSPIPSSPSSKLRTHAAFPFVGCTAISPKTRPDPYRAIFGSVGSSAARRRFETRAGRISR